ncbi:MAG TPA: hypothetical protein VFO19_07715, partial [Vicinamibacterales bacterium]|nr:hypothetical protein [Vicinamibacterales bacterium]
MSGFREWVRRLAYLTGRGRHDRDLRREMEAHRERLGSAAAFGNSLRLREEAADVWGWRWLDDAARDSKSAARSLRRRPGFTAVVVASLALVTGATTAIFAIVQAILIRPLPFDRPGELVAIHGRMWREDRPGPADRVDGPIGVSELDVYRASSTTIAGLAG